jgi:putative flippase GtrA
MTPTVSESRDDAAAPSRSWVGTSVRTMIAGALATALDYALAWTLFSLTGLAGLSTLLGCAGGGVTNYLLNRRWSFRSKAPVLSQALRYALVSGSSALLNGAGVELAVSSGLSYPLGWIAVRGLIFAGFTYPLFRFFVFAPPRRAPR